MTRALHPEAPIRVEAMGRSPMRASKRILVTDLLVRDGRQIESGDPVFGVKESLIKGFDEHVPGTPRPEARDLGGRTWARSRLDIALAPSGVRI